MAARTVKARVTGRVQGVWFRAWTERTARGLGLSGWVRNEPDGSVTALVSGQAEAVEKMVAALHEGPERARVDGVAVEDAAPPPEPGFHVAG